MSDSIPAISQLWPTKRRVRLRLLGFMAVTVAAWTVWGGLAFTTTVDECSSGDWPAFMLPINEGLEGRQRLGWIRWCNESHWTMNLAGQVAGETESRQARGNPEELFTWFDPNLTPMEAWARLTGGIESPRAVTPRHHQATTAYAKRAPNGAYRMEFSEEGIPLVAVVPGDDGFKFWTEQLDRAGRSMWSDEDPLNWPACSQPGDGGITEPQPCWSSSGRSKPGGACWVTLSALTSKVKLLSCAL